MSSHPNDLIIIMFLFSSCCCLHWIFKFSNFSSIFSIFLLVSRLRAGELSEPLGVVVWLTMYVQGRSPGKAMFGFLCFILILISFHLNHLFLHFFIPIFQC